MVAYFCITHFHAILFNADSRFVKLAQPHFGDEG